jgi:hypothetical protein
LCNIKRNYILLREINEKYDYILNLGDPSNESYDFNLIQKGELKHREKLH